LYNYQPAAPDTPFGLQSVGQPLTSQQIMDLIMGKQITQPSVTPATKVIPTPPGSAPINQLPISAPQLREIPMTSVQPTTSAETGVTNEQFQQVSKALGNDWLIRQQKAAQTGDWATYYQIQAQVYAILNPDTGGGG
jgi:hypothetical protein